MADLLISATLILVVAVLLLSFLGIVMICVRLLLRLMRWASQPLPKVHPPRD